MGSFYTNFVALGRDSTEVLQAAKRLHRRAFVIRDKNGDTLILDADCDEQDVAEIERLGLALADTLHSPVLGSLNHDDDHLLLWLFREGHVSRYESCLHGFAFGWSLSRVRGGIATYPFIAAVLVWPIVLFQVFRHRLLAAVSDLPPMCAGLGYTYLSQGVLPPGVSEDDIMRA